MAGPVVHEYQDWAMRHGLDMNTEREAMKTSVSGQRTRRRKPSHRKPTHPAVLAVLLVAMAALLSMSTFGGSAFAGTVTFTADELLGKPTDTSITINVVPAAAIQYYYKYGPTSGDLTQQTTPVDATGGSPSEVTITGLTANTKYYYQMVYDGDGNVNDGTSYTRTEHSFHTARAAGSSFAFAVTSDGHAGSTNSTYTNILNELPDFNIDMGDTFMTDGVSSQTSANTKYLAQRTSSTMGKAGVSVPIFLSSGNHEQEEGWHFSDGQALASIQARKLFFPTPVPGGSFYSANTDTLGTINAGTYGDQYREDYYAWTWGDALFVVIDPFQYTPLNSYGSIAGDGTSQQTTDQWTWTLGKQQYDWLKATLEGSTAKYKFVFSHQMVGGMTHSEPGTPAGYVRGGAEPASYYEWGGYNGSGVYDFNNQRSGWGNKPIHQLFVENHVSAYFHGHDHQYAYETRDGIAYVECPSAGGMSGGFSGIYTQSALPHTSPAGDFYTLRVISTSSVGHLRISVTSAEATIDYIQSSGSVADTRDILPNVTGPTLTLKPGWNLVAAATGTTTFPSSLFGWNGSAYTPTTAPASWQGYWYNNDTGVDQTVEIQTTTGTHLIDLSNGWNLIGNPLGSSASLSFSSAGSSAFVYNATTKAYEPKTTLLPGQGAWVQGVAGQTVTLTPSGG